MSRKHSKAKSFKFAFDGIRSCLKDEPNFRIHLSFGIIASLLAFYLNFNTTEWAVLILTISLVLVLELINTSIEAFLDVISPEKRPEVKRAKDTTAAAVLIASIAAIIIGALLFLPKLT